MKRSLRRTAVLFLSLILVLSAAACGEKEVVNAPVSAAEPPSELISLFEGVRTRVDDVTYSGMKAYSGVFTEDGGNRVVENVACASFYNGGDKSIRYMLIDAKTTDGQDLQFKLTSVPPMKTISVPELSAAPYVEGMEIESISCSQKIYFDTEPSAMEDTFSYAVSKGSITVTNISDADVTGEIAVYYKTVDGEELVGGTTYRTTIPGGLRAGDSAAAVAGHFDPENTAILFAEIVVPEDTSIHG